MEHTQPVYFPLWERFTAECRRVIQAFGLDPDAGDFQLSRNGAHRCAIVKRGDQGRSMAELSISVTAAHVFRDLMGTPYPCQPELQFHGWASPLALALQLALYPLVFDPVPRHEGAAVVDAAYAFGLRR